MNPQRRPDLRQVVRDNCIALYRHHVNGKRMSWSALARLAGIGNGTAQRINEQAADAALGTIDSIAAAFGLQAWQMLIPGLDPANPPVFWMTLAERKLYKDLQQAAQQMSEQLKPYKTGKPE